MLDRFARIVTHRLGAVLILVAAAELSALAFVTSPSEPAASPTDGLPAGAQSTRVVELLDRFPSARDAALIIVVERPDQALSGVDLEAAAAVRTAATPYALDGRVSPPIPSEDGRAALITLSVSGDLDAKAQTALVEEVRAAVAAPDRTLPAGLTVAVTGGPAFATDIASAFDGADITLLIATASVVAVLLLLTYRSPLLWLVPLAVIGVGDQVVAKLLPWLARLLGEPTEGQVSGIVSVLVFGAGTDYALLLISRYREELRRTPSRREAMRAAVREAAPALVASAGTVILALLTLLAAVVTGSRTLGVASAVGVAVALIFGLIVLPAALVSVPRGIFWPFVPKVGSAEPTTTGVWARIAGLVGRRPVAVLLVAVVLLGGLSAGLLATKVGLSQTEQFRVKPESVVAQEALARHFPAGSSQPAAVIVAAPAEAASLAAIRTVDGVADVGEPEASTDGQLVKIPIELTDELGTDAADRTVEALRSSLATVSGADALVGGPPASDLDSRDATLRDTLIVAPLVLGVVLLVLILLLRSVLAPIVLVATVVVSFAVSLGAATLVLTYALGLPALDSSVPLYAFLFLVALGVDYNIFLVTRAREEAATLGTRGGMLRALAATGGVITSAGIVLAAVFTVLGVLPVIALTQIGVIVGIGVLLDTLLVRTLVVPAITLLLGDRFWWPARPYAVATGSANTVADDDPRPVELSSR